MEDITLRAIRILGEVDLVAAEDTRRTGLLLKHHGIQNKLFSYYDHNKARQAPAMIARMQQGESVAIVSDAGTPGISDPAYLLVKMAVAAGINVIPVPGPTAAIAGLIVSGLPTDRFVFEGFLPVKKGRKTRLDILAIEPRTIILYEAPHRILRTLHDLIDHFGDRSITVCREMTKKFEEIIKGSISEMITHFSAKKPKGEFVLIIAGSKKHK